MQLLAILKKFQITLVKGIQLAAGPRDGLPVRRRPPGEADRLGLRPEQVHRLPDLLDRLQDDLELRSRAGVHVLEQRRDQALRWLPEGLGPHGAAEVRAGSLDGRQVRGQDDLRGSDSDHREDGGVPTR